MQNENSVPLVSFKVLVMSGFNATNFKNDMK